MTIYHRIAFVVSRLPQFDYAQAIYNWHITIEEIAKSITIRQNQNLRASRTRMFCHLLHTQQQSVDVFYLRSSFFSCVSALCVHQKSFHLFIIIIIVSRASLAIDNNKTKYSLLIS